MGRRAARIPTQANPVTLSYEQLRRLASVEVPAFIECAGNGRSFFNTQQGTRAAGTQWALGAIGVGNWRGVPLAEVLERAGLQRGAVDIMPVGLDPLLLEHHQLRPRRTGVPQPDPA